MARKRNRRNPRNKQEQKFRLEVNLPQNIHLVGEMDGNEEKRIYISQSVYQSIHRFTKNKTTNESGGMLIGNVVEIFGKVNILIQGFIEAKYTEATPTTLKFTHATWEYVHSELERRFEGGVIIGWIHTHPSFGIFLSEYDTFIHRNFFREENQIAYVVDPIQNIEGFFCWKNDKIELCKGFYIYDLPDRDINVQDEDDEEEKTQDIRVKPSGRALEYVLCAVIVLLIAAFALVSVNLLNRISILESQQDRLAENTNTTIAGLQQDDRSMRTGIGQLLIRVNTLETKVDALEKTGGDQNEAEPQTVQPEAGEKKEQPDTGEKNEPQTEKDETQGGSGENAEGTGPETGAEPNGDPDGQTATEEQPAITEDTNTETEGEERT